MIEANIPSHAKQPDLFEDEDPEAIQKIFTRINNFLDNPEVEHVALKGRFLMSDFMQKGYNPNDLSLFVSSEAMENIIQYYKTSLEVAKNPTKRLMVRHGLSSRLFPTNQPNVFFAESETKSGVGLVRLIPTHPNDWIVSDILPGVIELEQRLSNKKTQ